MRILLYCPLAPARPRIWAKPLMTMFRLDWADALPMVFGRNDTPHPRKYVDLCDKHNEARRLTLDGGYDALFLVENDMILPEDTLQRLTRMDTDVAYGLYVSRHGWLRWLAFYFLHGFVGDSYSLDVERARAVWNTQAETMGVGMGCTLIHRHVLQDLDFRTVADDAVADDWLFSQDCIERGYRQMHDFGLHCGHMMPDGKTLWPDIDAGGLYRVEYPEGAEMVPVTKDQPLRVNVGMETKIIHGQPAI